MFKKIMLAMCFFCLASLYSVTASASTINYDQLLPIAKKYIGVPYKWAGNSDSGFDCSGYIHKVFSEMNIKLPRTTGELFNEGTFVAKDNLRVGDLVFFNTSGKGVSHAGIYIGSNQFIHASTSKGVMISNVDDPYYYKSRYIGARRVLDYTLDVGQFHDVQNRHWAFQEVKTLANEDVTIGYSMSYFKPEEQISRADVATMLSEAFGLEVSNRKSSFPDVPTSHWAIGVVNAVYKEGIFKGNDNSQFRPADSLTRGQMAAIISRAFNLPEPADKKMFTDVPSTHWAYADVQKLAASGITTGYADQMFKPENKVSRSQFAAFLYRAQFQ